MTLLLENQWGYIAEKKKGFKNYFRQDDLEAALNFEFSWPAFNVTFYYIESHFSWIIKILDVNGCVQKCDVKFFVFETERLDDSEIGPFHI